MVCCVLLRSLNFCADDAATTPTGFAEIYRSAKGNLTASSVIAVMPACMLMFPNPGSPNDWPMYCVGGIHYMGPFRFGEEVALVMVFALTADIPRKQSKAAKQHPRFLFDNFARIPRKQNKARNSIPGFPFKQHP
jgi:hypothetical protein